jgi:hypothetical protein
MKTVRSILLHPVQGQALRRMQAVAAALACVITIGCATAPSNKSARGDAPTAGGSSNLSFADCEKAREDARNTKPSLFNRKAGVEAKKDATELCKDAEAAACARLASWVRSAHVPGLVTRRPGVPDPGIPVLLEDKRFTAAFGRPYDQMPQDELRWYTSTVLPHCSTSKTPAAVLSSDERTMVLRALAKTNAGVVNNQRQAAGTIESLTEEAAGLQATDAGYERLIAMMATGGALRSTVSPEDWNEYLTAYGEAEKRIAIAAEDRIVAKAIPAASGLNGMIALTELQYSPLSKLSTAPELKAARAANKAKVDQRLSELGSAFAAVERQRIDGLGSGAPGLQRGVQYQQEFSAGPGKIADKVKELAALKTYFSQRREAMLASAKTDLSDQIRRARSESELDQLSSRYLLDSDKTTVAGTEILSVIEAQKYELEKRAVLGQGDPTSTSPTSAGVRQTAGKDTGARGEPTESEMYDAVASRIGSMNQATSDRAQACRSGNLDSATGVLCALTIGMQQGRAGTPYRITTFEKHGCAAAVGKPGYVCDYLIGTSGGALSASGRMVEQIARNGDRVTTRFVQSNTGTWISIPPE